MFFEVQLWIWKQCVTAEFLAVHLDVSVHIPSDTGTLAVRMMIAPPCRKAKSPSACGPRELSSMRRGKLKRCPSCACAVCVQCQMSFIFLPQPLTCESAGRVLGRTQVKERSTHARPGMHMQQCSASSIGCQDWAALLIGSFLSFGWWVLGVGCWGGG